LGWFEVAQQAADKEEPMQGNILRGALGALVLIVTYWAFDPIEDAIYHHLALAFGLHMAADGEMKLLPYATLMMVRFVLDLAVVGAVLGVLGRGWDFPFRTRRFGILTVAGFATGLFVMTGAILEILIVGGATVKGSAQPPTLAALYGAGWLVSDYLGAAGEELYGRVAVLLVAQALLGWRGAALVSGLMFSVMHLGNPGASIVWLARLFVQGVLLAYAVFRTGSVWWSIAYHTGWNWASAPLFGAAGSGYLDQGHIFDFTPTGASWLTGGSVGPEGSLFAFVAVLCALALLEVVAARTSDKHLQTVHLKDVWNRKHG